MRRWTTVPVPYTRRDAEWFLCQVGQGWADGTTASFAIALNGCFAGTVDLRLRERAWGDVGFGLAPWARGRRVRAGRCAWSWGGGALARPCRAPRG